MKLVEIHRPESLLGGLVGLELAVQKSAIG